MMHMQAKAYQSVQVPCRLTAGTLSVALVVEGDKAVVEALLAFGAGEVYIRYTAPLCEVCMHSLFCHQVWDPPHIHSRSPAKIRDMQWYFGHRLVILGHVRGPGTSTLHLQASRRPLSNEFGNKLASK